MARLARHPWRVVLVGLGIHFGWLGVGAAFYDDVAGPDPVAALTAVTVPLLLGSALVVAGALAGLTVPRRRSGRIALGMAAAAGGLQGVAVLWDWINELRGSESSAYLALWIVGFVLLPAALVASLSGRRFARGPEAVREPLRRRVRRGWREATRSWIVLVGSGRLLVLPAMSYVLGIATWIGAYALAGRFADATTSRLAIASFIVLLPGTTFGTFFGVAFVWALNERLSGKPVTVRDALAAAWGRRRSILGWSLFAAGVGGALQALQQLRSEWAAAPLLSWLAGAAWGVLTLFVLPILALEDLGLRDTVRRAGSLVRRRWGEGMAGATNLTLVAGLAGGVLGLGFGVAFALAAPNEDATTALAVIGVAAFLLLLAAVAAAGQVLALALYRHAIGLGAMPPFTDDDLEHAVVPRRRLRRRRS